MKINCNYIDQYTYYSEKTCRSVRLATLRSKTNVTQDIDNTMPNGVISKQ